MAIPLEYRKRILEKLPRGSQSRIAERYGFYHTRVSAWFHGLNSSQAIEDAVCEYFNEYIKEYVDKQKKTTQIKAIIDTFYSE